MYGIDSVVTTGYAEHVKRLVDRLGKPPHDSGQVDRYEAASALESLMNAVTLLRGGDRPLVPKLREMIPLALFDARWALFLGSYRTETYDLPTEVVVRSARDILDLRLAQARAYPTNLYLYRGRCVPVEELQRDLKERFKGTHAFEEIYLVEVWGDHGDDGHTDYRQRGFAFVPASDLDRGAGREPDSRIPGAVLEDFCESTFHIKYPFSWPDANEKEGRS